MAEATEQALNFEEIEIDGPQGPVLAVVGRPVGTIRLDQSRLEAMRSGDFASRVDLEILQAVLSRGGKVQAVVFDAEPHGDDSWGFEGDLHEEQTIELGYHLLKSQTVMYRELARAGVLVLAGVGFGRRELAAFQRGTVRVISELGETASSDAWLVEHLALWTGLTYDEFVPDKLHAAMAERRARRGEIEELLAREASP